MGGEPDTPGNDQHHCLDEQSKEPKLSCRSLQQPFAEISGDMALKISKQAPKQNESDDLMRRSLSLYNPVVRCVYNSTDALTNSAKAALRQLRRSFGEHTLHNNQYSGYCRCA